MLGTKRSRLITFAGIGVAVGGIAVGLVQAQPDSPPRTLVRSGQPSCAEAIRQLGLQNERVTCPSVAAEVGAATTPSRYGPYRIVPAGYRGPLTVQDLPNAVASGTPTSDRQRLMQSRFGREPAYVPSGYRLAEFNSGEVSPDQGVYMRYEGPRGRSQSLEISRGRIVQDPIDIYAPGQASPSQLTQTTIGGATAVVITDKSDSPSASSNHITMYVARDGVNITVTSALLPLDEVKRVVESLP